MFHFDLPLRLKADGSFATTVADSAQDVANSVGVLVATRTGERLSVPTYGTPDPLFGGVDVDAVRAAVAAWEPRAAGMTVTVNVDGENTEVTMDGGVD